MEATQTPLQSLKQQLAKDVELVKAFESSFPSKLKQGDFIDYKRNNKWVVAKIKQRVQDIIVISFDGFDPETVDV
jgi:hypothetical protein